MTKYCMKCGAQSDDSAAFCASCGDRFPEQASIIAATATVGAVSPPQGDAKVFVVELGVGAHKHMPTDVYLKDAQGDTSLVARKQSLLHLDYTIVDATETPVGYIQHKTHLSHSSFIVEDSGRAPLGSVNISSVRATGALPSCWIDDPSGNKQATLTYTNRQLAFNATKVDGTMIFEASFPGQGIRQTLADVEHKVHNVSVYDPDFPLPVLLAIFVAVDTMG